MQTKLCDKEERMTIGAKMQLWVGSYDLNIHYNFLKLFCKARKIHKLCGSIICISINVEEQKSWHNKLKMEFGMQHKKNQTLLRAIHSVCS